MQVNSTRRGRQYRARWSNGRYAAAGAFKFFSTIVE